MVGGNLTAKQLAKIAEVAENFGDGYVHLTSRQSVEIPFIKLDDVENVKAALAEGDVEPGVCGPRVRTITACQGQAICPSGCIDTYSLAKELDDGQILSVKMNDGEPVQNVPRSIKEEGHQILKLIDNEDGTYNLIVKKVGD